MPKPPKSQQLYESKISTLRWVAYDLPGNAGWLAFLVGLGQCFAQKPAYLQNRAVFGLLCLDLLCGAAMLAAIAELISERICRLDRVLPKARLYRGFGALTFAGLAGLVFSAAALACARGAGFGQTGPLALLCAGGALCFVFGGLLLRQYKKRA